MAARGAASHEQSEGADSRQESPHSGTTQEQQHLRELSLMVQMARMYYDEGKTQQEIGDALGLTRIRVNRLLQQARDLGIVRIQVVDPLAGSPGTAQRLQEKFGLQHALVVPTTAMDSQELAEELGRAAASLVDTLFQDGFRIGLGWGTTVSATVRHLSRQEKPAAHIIPLVGGMGEFHADFQINELARRMAERWGAHWHALEVPSVMGSREARDAIVEDPLIAETVRMWDELDAALVGIGGTITHSPMLRTRYFSRGDIIEMDEARAIGDICLRFFNTAGEVCPLPLYDRIVAIDLETLRKAPLVLGVAGGIAKLGAIHSALRGRWVNGLVVDYQTAEQLLALPVGGAI